MKTGTAILIGIAVWGGAYLLWKKPDEKKPEEKKPTPAPGPLPPPPPPKVEGKWVTFSGCFNPGKKYRIPQAMANTFSKIQDTEGFTIEGAKVVDGYVEFVYPAGSPQLCPGGPIPSLEEWEVGSAVSGFAWV